MKNPELPAFEDEVIGVTACREFERVTGYSAEMLKVSRTRMPAWDTSWDALLNVDLPRGLSICSNYSARPGILGRIGEAKRLARNLATTPGSIDPRKGSN
jgi:oxygen-dependent protoporphyrinogen oxidase